MSKHKGSNPAIEVARERLGEGPADGVRVLSTGIRARILPVASSLIDEISMRIPDPDIPNWHNPDKDRDEPNPSDPQYLKELRKATYERGRVAIDAFIMFGIELESPPPEDDGWVRKLKFLNVEFDATDGLAREFHYKKYIAIGSEDIALVSRISQVTGEDVDRAVASFRSPA